MEAQTPSFSEGDSLDRSDLEGIPSHLEESVQIFRFVDDEVVVERKGSKLHRRNGRKGRKRAKSEVSLFSFFQTCRYSRLTSLNVLETRVRDVRSFRELRLPKIWKRSSVGREGAAE